jgi:pimeloyl-ACP methyl ester carboxylesterase
VPDPAPPSWHALAPEACQAALAAAQQGLTTEQASERLAALGPNRLEPEPGRGRLRILFDQFGNVMLLLLLAVAAVAAWLDLSAQRLPRDTIAIGLIVVLNAALGYLQESRAERALQALRQLAQPQVSVCRDGQWQVLAAEQLVPVLAALGCPLHGIWGAQDVLYRHRLPLIHRVLSSAPGFRSLELLPDAGHWVQFERPAAFHAALSEALSTHIGA